MSFLWKGWEKVSNLFFHGGWLWTLILGTHGAIRSKVSSDGHSSLWGLMVRFYGHFFPYRRRVGLEVFPCFDLCWVHRQAHPYGLAWHITRNIMGRCSTIPHNTLESTKLQYNYQVLNFQRLFIIANTWWEIMFDYLCDANWTKTFPSNFRLHWFCKQNLNPKLEHSW
jgi:hypothetical protein